MTELADTSAHPGLVADLADRDAPAYQQLLDLSLVDERFSPAVIEVTLERLIDLWEQAVMVKGGKDQMATYADNETIRALQFPKTLWDKTMLTVMDAVLLDWNPIGIKRDEYDTARLDVDLRIAAVRYLVSTVPRPGPRPPGSRSQPREISLRWTLQSTDQADPLWRLTETSNPAADLPGTMP